VRGAQVDVLVLTGGVAVDVWLTAGRTRGSARRLCLNETMTELAISVIETKALPTFYSRFTRWFWLKFVLLDRATQVLQLWFKNQSLTRPAFQTTRLPSTQPRNCVNQT